MRVCWPISSPAIWSCWPARRQGDETSAHQPPHDRPLTPNDLWATVYRHMGINQDATINDYTGRPQLLLPFGEPIRELL